MRMKVKVEKHRKTEGDTISPGKERMREKVVTIYSTDTEKAILGRKDKHKENPSQAAATLPV